MLEQVPPEGLQPMEGPTLEQGRGVRRKELQRVAVINRPQSLSCCTTRGGEIEEPGGKELKLSLGVRAGGKVLF